jgi:hypothetical protein
MLPFPQVQMQVIITLWLACENIAIYTLLTKQTVPPSLFDSKITEK